MFSIPRTNVIESDTGFSIEVLGRTGMRYSEGGRTVEIDSEVLATKGISIAQKSIRVWDSPRGHEPISDIEKSTIIENVRQALAFRNVSFEVL